MRFGIILNFRHALGHLECTPPPQWIIRGLLNSFYLRTCCIFLMFCIRTILDCILDTINYFLEFLVLLFLSNKYCLFVSVGSTLGWSSAIDIYHLANIFDLSSDLYLFELLWAFSIHGYFRNSSGLWTVGICSLFSFSLLGFHQSIY